jgi:hypothetical protein
VKIGSFLPCLAWMSRAMFWTCWMVISGLMKIPSGVHPVIPKSFSRFSFRSFTMSMKILGFWGSVTLRGFSSVTLRFVTLTSGFSVTLRGLDRFSVTLRRLDFTRHLLEQNFAVLLSASNSFSQIVQISLVICFLLFG